MSLSNIVGKTNTIAAWLIGILFLVLSTNAPRALEFSRHSADSSGLNAIAATSRVVGGCGRNCGCGSPARSCFCATRSDASAGPRRLDAAPRQRHPLLPAEQRQQHLDALARLHPRV